MLGFIGAIGYATQTFCMLSVPVVIWTLIINCAPIYAAIAAYFLMGEKVNRFYFMSAIGTFAGILIVTLNQKEKNDNGKLNGVKVVSYSVAFRIICALIDSLCYGVTIVSNRFYQNVHWTIQMMT